MGKFDVAMRTILRDGCDAFLAAIGIATPVRSLSVKLPRVSAREVDFIGEDAQGVIHHVEFQSTNDPTMHARMLTYAALIGERIMEDRAGRATNPRHSTDDHRPFPAIRQTVVYIGKGAMRMPDGIDFAPHLVFRFGLVDARSLDPRALLESPAVGDAVLAVLCRDGAKPDTVRAILRRIGALESHRRDEAYGRLLILSELREASRIVETEQDSMNIQVDLDNIASIREHARQARIDLLLAQIAVRFGHEASALAAERLAVADAKQLAAVALRVLDAATPGELFEVTPEQGL